MVQCLTQPACSLCFDLHSHYQPPPPPCTHSSVFWKKWGGCSSTESNVWAPPAITSFSLASLPFLHLEFSFKASSNDISSPKLHLVLSFFRNPKALWLSLCHDTNRFHLRCLSLTLLLLPAPPPLDGCFLRAGSRPDPFLLPIPPTKCQPHI